MLKTIIPTCTDSLICKCLDSMEKSEPDSTRSVIVGDNGLNFNLIDKYPLVTRIVVPKNPFVHMQALNRLVEASDNSDDLLIMGDDSEIVSSNWLTNSEQLLQNWPSEFGMLNFLETKLLQFGDYKNWWDNNRDAPFTCLATQPLAGSVIPRKVFDKVGRFDERYIGYAYDDVDYCFRLLHDGYKIGLTSVVQYNHDGCVSYQKETSGHTFLTTVSTINYVLFCEKWNIPFADFKRQGFPDTKPHMSRESCKCAPIRGY